MIPVTLEHAQALRDEADKTGNPETYEKAAAEFTQLGYIAAANQCRKRARHYRLMDNLKQASGK